jgi:hypothetical protein
MSKTATTTKVTQLFDMRKWKEARKLLKADLEQEPDNHWLLTRLATTYYEEKDYATAKSYAEQALALVPDCPLAMWELAGALQMLDNPEVALRIYTDIVAFGIKYLEGGSKVDGCWENQAWAESLMADSIFRAGTCYRELRNKDRAVKSFISYLRLIAQGVQGIYSLEDVRENMAALDGSNRKIIIKEAKTLVEA